MKNLNEKSMMQEMNLQEMKEVNGGLGVPIGPIVKWGKRALTAIDIGDAAERFIDGWNSAGDSREFK